MDLVGDLGGVIDLIIFVFGLFLYPYSQYSYNLEMQRYLYKARTNDVKLFKPEKTTIKGPQFKITNKMKQELEKHHTIVLAPLDKFKLFLSQYFEICCLKQCWKRKKKLMKIYEQGVSKIENDLNVFKLLQNVKTMKTMLKKTDLTKEVKHHI